MDDKGKGPQYVPDETNPQFQGPKGSGGDNTHDTIWGLVIFGIIILWALLAGVNTSSPDASDQPRTHGEYR